MRIFRLFLLGVLAMSAIGVRAQSDFSLQDRQGIDATMDAFGADLYRLDFASFGGLLTEDCDWINIVGMHWIGKAQVVKGHTAVFSTRYKGMTMQQIERTVSRIGPDTALLINKQSIGPDKTPDGKPLDNVSLMTVVLQKKDGKWLIRAGENVVIDQRAAAHDPVKMP